MSVRIKICYIESQLILLQTLDEELAELAEDYKSMCEGRDREKNY